MTGHSECQPMSEDDYAFRFQYADGSAFQIYEDGRAFITFPEKDGHQRAPEQKFGKIDNRIRLLKGEVAKPRQDQIDHLWHRIRKLEHDNNQAAGRIMELERDKKIIEAQADAYARELAAGQVEAGAARIAELEKALRAIMKATVEGRVCDDVAWFDSIMTLHDFCDIALNGPEPDAAARTPLNPNQGE